MSNSNQSAKSGNMVSGEGTVENVVDLLLAQSTGEVSPLYEDNTINNQPAASGNFFNAEGEVENIVDVLLEKTSSEPLYEDKNNTLNTQPIKTGNMVASDGKVYNIVDLLKNVGGGGGGDTPFMFMKMLTAGTMTSDTSFDVEWEKELPDLSTETYTASFTFEETEEDSGEWRLTCGVTKEGRYLGETDVYAIITAHDGSMSAPIKLTTLTKDGENPYSYGFNAGGYECYFHVEIENDTTITFTGGNAYIGEDDYGSVDVYWQIEPTTPAPVQKGSFDSTTQQLTLNYDYLVEMINSSTALTDEQKTTKIASLNNSDMVIDMSVSAIPANEFVYGFQATENDGLYVDVATPVTLKTAVIAANPSVFSGIGTYKAMADFQSSFGDPVTEEQMEAQFSPFIVDENLCTVSGTIGNFSVEFN